MPQHSVFTSTCRSVGVGSAIVPTTMSPLRKMAARTEATRLVVAASIPATVSPRRVAHYDASWAIRNVYGERLAWSLHANKVVNAFALPEPCETNETIHISA
jgi:hypothetical protein